MRFSIERVRTAVLVAGVLLLAALGVFLAVGKGRNLFNRRDLPKRLGVEIEQEANGVTYTQAHGGRTLFKIHASKVVQLKRGNALLHDVKIELYGEDGSRVDRIEGGEFEYDQQQGTAKAAGPVEITLMRPGVAPAIAPRATPEQAVGVKPKGSTLAVAAQAASSGQIHVKTSGLTFDQNSGLATTAERVEFSLAQGKGSAMGATYDSGKGLLVLDRAVELDSRRGGEAVQISAQHAEFERGDQVCRLRMAKAGYRDDEATAGEAKILFRADGSVLHLDATGEFTLRTAEGSQLAASTGALDFDQHNQLRHGHLEGGVTMSSAREGRRMHAASPTAELVFAAKGELRSAHLERGVEIQSDERSETAAGPLRVSRTWKSPVADVDFRDAGHGQVEPAAMHGSQGVIVTGESQHGKGPVEPFRLTADELTGRFGSGSVLTAMTGLGHASLEETTASGIRQTTRGDRLEAHFAAGGAAGAKTGTKGGEGREPGGAAQIQSATVDGHVLLAQEPAAKLGVQAQAPLRATAGRAVYEGAGEWLRMTLSPRVEDGGLQLTADRIDVSKESGDALAHGNVKATWVGAEAGKRAPAGALSLGGQGPAHVVAAEAQLHQAQGEADGVATFSGHARLWQQTNSIAAPVIVLDRWKRTLAARSADPADPVRVVLVSADGSGPGRAPGKEGAAKPAPLTVIRMRGGSLNYSDAERKAVMQGGAAGTVVAETAAATSVSSEVELLLLPLGNHAGKDGGEATVDHMTARGRVTVTFNGRRGTGEQLVYSGESGEYVLTGTSAAPPRMTDPARGTVTGEALIFHSRDDSVSIEGGGRKTTTETTAPR